MGPALHQIRLLQAALAYVAEHSCWVVIVVGGDPSNPARMLDLLLAICPQDIDRAGRTLLLPGGGRLTVSALLHSVPSSDFHVVLVDTEAGGDVAKALHSPDWLARAKSVLFLDEQGNRLVRL